MMVAEKKERLLSKEELCKQKGMKVIKKNDHVFLFSKKKSEKMDKKIKKNQSSHQSFFNNSYLSDVS
jgi:NhaP-type Na+/H+ and K+/H+ antiporter